MHQKLGSNSKQLVVPVVNILLFTKYTATYERWPQKKGRNIQSEKLKFNSLNLCKQNVRMTFKRVHIETERTENTWKKNKLPLFIVLY